MKKLVIIVPKDSALDFYLANEDFIYYEIECLCDRTYYKMNISSSLQLIDFLVCKFCLQSFTIRCNDGVVTFCVFS